MKWLGLLLVVLALAVVFVLGRRIEGARDSDWQGLAARLGAEFQGQPGAALLSQFGTGAPWMAWASDGELQCPRAIQGRDAAGPFALLQVRYSVRQRRGEEQPDAWYEVSVATVRLAQARTGAAPAPVATEPGYEAVHNGEWLFLWKKGRLGAGESLQPEQLPELLERARRLVRQP